MEVVLITQNIKMKYKTSVILAFLYCYFFPLSAQIPLTTTTNTLRHGDILCKVEVPYVEAGERGEEVVWQLGEITDDSRDHLQGDRTCRG